jgi:SAM-dependent methyltransferase
MNDLPLADGAFAAVWSEGAIFVVGFAAGLRRWRRLLRPGGWVALSEATWLCESPPSEVADWWNAEYPAITTVETNLAVMAASGFEPAGHFVMPRQDWADYLEPVERHARRLRDERPDDAQVQTFTDALLREVDMWRRYGGSYGYVFYLGRAV